MAQWGCTYDELRAINPTLVMLSLSGYGRTGPRGSYRAYATNISCFIGLTHAWGHTHGTLTDYLCSAHGVLGVLAGLALVARHGEGTFVDAAQIETAAAVMAPMLLDALVNEREITPRPNEVEGALLSGVFRCAADDGWLALELEDGDDWAALCTLLDRPDLAVPRSAAAPDRDALAQAVAAWAAPLSPHTAALLLQHAGLAAGAVQNMEDVARDPSMRSRGMIVEVDQVDLGVLEYAQSPYRMSVTPGRYRRPGARLGQHTDDVLREWLALGDTELDALEADGAIFRA
jgi:crotonobetainyl-CoA:carnitine CoA-transferase CaiB-like acyl-CoA transferase